MTERLPQIHNSDSDESRQCYTQPGQESRPRLFNFENLSPESQAIYDASRAGSRFDHLIDHALLLARIQGDEEQIVYASEPDDTFPGSDLLDAVQNKRWNEARGLIRAHVDVNATNAMGQTALHLASDPGVVDALLRFGRGKTSLMTSATDRCKPHANEVMRIPSRSWRVITSWGRLVTSPLSNQLRRSPYAEFKAWGHPSNWTYLLANRNGLLVSTKLTLSSSDT